MDACTLLFRRKNLLPLLLTALLLAASAQQQDLSVKGMRAGGGRTLLDTLGPHDIGGRGCSGCHPPHISPPGSAPVVDSPATFGEGSLWGENLTPIYGYTLNLGTQGRFQETLPSSAGFAATNDEVRGIMICLSCHDGNIAKGKMMTNMSWEQVKGLLPSSAYGSLPIPTLLGRDGGDTGNYRNDHPVGQLATLGAVGVANRFTVSTCGTPPDTFACLNTVDPAYLEFIGNYGAFQLIPGGASFIAIPPGANTATNAYVVCTTCHTPHNLYIYRAGAAPGARVGLGHNVFDTTGAYPTYFFVKAPYNPGAIPAVNQASSATQFCRGCHFSDEAGANEANEIHNVLTQY